MISNINSNHLQALQSTPQHSAPATPAKAQESTSPQVGSDSVSLGGQRESLDGRRTQPLRGYRLR